MYIDVKCFNVSSSQECVENGHKAALLRVQLCLHQLVTVSTWFLFTYMLQLEGL